MCNLINHVRNYFRRLKQCFVCHKLTLNDDKSYFRVYHTVDKFVPEGLEKIATGDIITKRSRTVKYIGLHIDELLSWKTHIAYFNESLIKLFGIFNQSKDYVSAKLATKIYYSFAYSRINYGIEVYGSCAKTSLERVQILPNKLLLTLHPLTSTNWRNGDMKILKIKDVYDLSLCVFGYRSLPACLRNIFVKRNTPQNTHQTGQLDYFRARMELGITMTS